MKNHSKNQNYILDLFTWKIVILFLAVFCFLTGCKMEKSKHDFLAPREIIDLGGLVTEDLPDRIWGRDLMKAFGFEKSNHFEVINWEFEMGTGKVSGSNAYYTFFNHGGPHVDGPNHVGFNGGLDSYSLEQFIGPLKVFDVSEYPNGRTVPVEVFKNKVSTGDIVLIYTNYIPPQSAKTPPGLITLSHKAAEYLAEIPIKAFCTDAFSVACNDNSNPVEADSETARAVPIHHSFLSRSIPIYEELCDVEKLLTKQNMYFIGVPLNIKDGDGMLVRPVVFVF